jgi:predicted TIM-barrel fold metal-dependent hydrolase
MLKHHRDSHIHVIDAERFPLDADRDYTPKAATTSNATDFQKSMGLEHFVIVHPSVYGTDNRALLDALAYFNGTARGVCVVDPDTVTNTTLHQYHDAGVRGIRLSMKDTGTNLEIVAAVKKFAAVARVHDWVLQLRVPLKAFVALEEVIPKLGVRIVVDHFAYPQAGSKTNNTQNTIDPYRTTGFSEVIELVQRKLLFVKISGPYLNSNLAPFYEDMRVITQALIINGPDMVVYGSDWPHTSNKEGNAAVGGRLNPADYKKIDDKTIVEIYKEWSESKGQIQRLFVDNPRRLWGWTDFSS